MTRKLQRSSSRCNDQVPDAVVKTIFALEDHLEISDEQGLCEGLISALLTADKCKAISAHHLNFASVAAATGLVHVTS